MVTNGRHSGGCLSLRDCIYHHRSFYRQSSSASRFTAGAVGFLNFSQSGERPGTGRFDGEWPDLKNAVAEFDFNGELCGR